MLTRSVLVLVLLAMGLALTNPDSAAARDEARPRLVVSDAGGARSVSSSADGRWAVTAGQWAPARVWNTRAGAVIRRLGGGCLWLSAAVMSPDGRLVAIAERSSVDESTKLKVWDWRRGRVVATLRAGLSFAYLKFLSRPRCLVWMDGAPYELVHVVRLRVDGRVLAHRLIRLRPGRRLLQVLESHGKLQLVVWAPGGGTFILEPEDGGVVARFPTEAEDVEDPVPYCVPGGGVLLLGAGDAWAAFRTTDLAQTMKRATRGVPQVGPQGEIATLVGKQLRVWDGHTGRLVEDRVLSGESAKADEPRRCSLIGFTGRPSVLLLAEGGGESAWDGGDGQSEREVHELDYRSGVRRRWGARPPRHDWPGSAPVFDGSRLPPAGRVHYVNKHVWDLGSGRCVPRPDGVSVDLDGPMVQRQSQDGAWVAYRVGTRLSVSPLGWQARHEIAGDATAHAFIPGSRRLVYLTADQAVVYDTERSAETRVDLEGVPDGDLELRVGANGRAALVIASRRGGPPEYRLLDLETGSAPTWIRAGDVALDVSLSGQYVAIRRDEAVRIVSFADGRGRGPVLRIEGSVSLSEDGSTLTTLVDRDKDTARASSVVLDTRTGRTLGAWAIDL